jgi:protein required for attachment to host cells
MEIRQLQNQLRTLIELEETESPVVSYFLDSKDPDGASVLREQVLAARKALDPDQRPAFDRALDRIEDHVPWKLDESTRSVAVFARSGSSPLFLVMEFRVGLQSRLFVESTPAVFPLVELKDNYHRYVLMICNEASARVLEVSLGSVTREAWTRRPELRKRVGREWTKLHYQNHRRDRADRFVKEKIALVERIVASGGHSHLMLAGNPRVVARVRKALPKSLERKLVDTIPAAARDRASDVIVATLSSFIEHEEQESLSTVGLLRQELRRGGLAVCGFKDSRDALERGQVDQLIILSDGDDMDAVRREELVKLAVRNDVHVEVVQHSEELADLGGVGCLLRYYSPTSDLARSTSDVRVWIDRRAGHAGGALR